MIAACASRPFDHNTAPFSQQLSAPLHSVSSSVHTLKHTSVAGSKLAFMKCSANGKHLLAQLHILGHAAGCGRLGQPRGHARAAELQVALEEGLLARACPRGSSVHLQHMPAGAGDHSSCALCTRCCKILYSPLNWAQSGICSNLFHFIVQVQSSICRGAALLPAEGQCLSSYSKASGSRASYWQA